MRKQLISFAQVL